MVSVCKHKTTNKNRKNVECQTRKHLINISLNSYEVEAFLLFVNKMQMYSSYSSVEREEALQEMMDFDSNKLTAKLNLSSEQFEKWLQSMGLLPTARRCICGGNMHLRPKVNLPVWRCTINKCRKQCGYYKGTMFENSRLPIKHLIQFMFLWCKGKTSHAEMTLELQKSKFTISSRTIVDKKSLYRNLCYEYYKDNPVLLGGPDIVVEIDVTIISKTGKFDEKQQWLFGAVERKTGRCLVIPMKQRDESILLSIISAHILPHSIIMSDSWTGYNGITSLPGNYHHYSMNQSEPLLDLHSDTHIQTIEEIWALFNKRNQNENDTSYVYQFMWKRQFGGKDDMYHLFKQITQKYLILSQHFDTCF